MAQPPPNAVRYLVLIAAISLLGLAVCTKTQQGQSPDPQPVEVQQEEPTAAGSETAFDAGVDSTANQLQQQAPNQVQQVPNQAQQQTPNRAPNPPAKVDKGNTTDKPPKEEFFNATKSGGMF